MIQWFGTIWWLETRIDKLISLYELCFTDFGGDFSINWINCRGFPSNDWVEDVGVMCAWVRTFWRLASFWKIVRLPHAVLSIPNVFVKKTVNLSVKTVYHYYCLVFDAFPKIRLLSSILGIESFHHIKDIPVAIFWLLWGPRLPVSYWNCWYIFPIRHRYDYKKIVLFLVIWFDVVFCLQMMFQRWCQM